MPATELEQTIAHLVALRRVAAALDDPVERRRLDRVVRDLRRRVGVGVPKRRAAAVLGVSVQALERWIGYGLLRVVRKPDSYRELIDAEALLAVAEEVTRRRELGQTRNLLATALRELERDGRLPRKLRPNQSARELREGYLQTTGVERLREVAELSHTAGILSAQGAAARGRPRPGRV